MALLDLLGRRWTLRIIWELREEPLTFRELQARCEDMSSSVLSQRLADIAEADITESAHGGYRLTPEGRRLLALYPPVQAWADRWADRSRHG
jgi:DNA-binding HxlR family transcriptional regulator